MTEKRLPSHISEADLRAVSEVLAATLGASFWNAAIDAALEQVEAVNQYDEVPVGVTLRLEALRRPDNG